jgi:hypothetical protein
MFRFVLKVYYDFVSMMIVSKVLRVFRAIGLQSSVSGGNSCGSFKVSRTPEELWLRHQAAGFGKISKS